MFEKSTQLRSYFAKMNNDCKAFATPITGIGCQQCLLFSWTILRGKDCPHPIAVIGFAHDFGLCGISGMLGPMIFPVISSPNFLAYASLKKPRKISQDPQNIWLSLLYNKIDFTHKNLIGIRILTEILFIPIRLMCIQCSNS
jgi:hypothetical protein